MKLSIVVITLSLMLSGCSKPELSNNENAKEFTCGSYDVLILSEGESKKIVLNYNSKLFSYETELVSDKFFNSYTLKTWSFHNLNGRYFLGFIKYPNINSKSDGYWCEQKK